MNHNIGVEDEKLLPETGSHSSEHEFELLFNLMEDYGFSQLNEAPPKLNKKAFSAELFLAVASGVLFLFSAEGANKRYRDLTQSMPWLNWMFVIYLPNIGNCITNIFFNAESYATILDSMKPKSDAEAGLTGVKTEYGIWSIAWLAAVGTVLPTWYVSFTGRFFDKFLASFSALANLPVNADGAKSLIDWARRFNYKKSCLTDQENALLKARNIVVAALEKKAERVLLDQATPSVNAAEMPESISFEDLLDEESSVQSKKTGSFTLGVMAFFAVLGVYQNYGGVYDGYEAGDSIKGEFGKPLGYFAAASYFLPGLGFTVKGLLNCVFPLIQLKTTPSLAKQKLPKAYRLLMGVTVFFALFSGFTADQMGHDAWQKLPGWGGETGAFWSGVASNMGAALIFNLPQAMLFVSHVLNLYLINHSDPKVLYKMQLSQKINHLAGTLKRMPVENCKKFFADEAMPVEKLSKLLAREMKQEEIQLLGDTHQALSSVQTFT